MYIIENMCTERKKNSGIVYVNITTFRLKKSKEGKRYLIEGIEMVFKNKTVIEHHKL